MGALKLIIVSVSNSSVFFHRGLVLAVFIHLAYILTVSV